MNIYNDVKFFYKPYPICWIGRLFDDATYDRMAETFPDVDTNWRHLSQKSFEGQDKYYLNESRTPDRIQAVFNTNPEWGRFYAYIKSMQFISDTMRTLKDHNIDLGYFDAQPPLARRLRTALGDLVKRRRLPEFPVQHYTRFEFSSLPASGGRILPHADDPKKILALVIYFPRRGEWNPAFGGGLDMIEPKDESNIYNQRNRKAAFSDFNLVRTFPYQPNQGSLFIKTFNSWHSVGPIKGEGSQINRKSVTITICVN